MSMYTESAWRLIVLTESEACACDL
jgi:hypothetical protein